MAKQTDEPRTFTRFAWPLWAISAVLVVPSVLFLESKSLGPERFFSVPARPLRRHLVILKARRHHGLAAVRKQSQLDLLRLGASLRDHGVRRRVRYPRDRYGARFIARSESGGYGSLIGCLLRLFPCPGLCSYGSPMAGYLPLFGASSWLVAVDIVLGAVRWFSSRGLLFKSKSATCRL